MNQITQNGETLQIGLNNETAAWVNSQQQRMEKGTRLLIDIALNIGEVLATVQKSHNETFAEWVETNLTFSRPTAYRFISLYNHKNQVSGAENLTEAYKMIETLEAQQKKTETAKAYQRVEEYRKTGIKPEGWRRGTDDKLAKEEAARNERIEAIKQEAETRKEAREDRERERENLKAETHNILNFLDQSTKNAQKRSEFKEKIRLSFDGENDPFIDALMDYLDGLDNDSIRIGACHNIIKVCKKIAADLQSK